MSNKKRYKILTPPLLVTIEPGKEDPFTPPVTEVCFDEADLTDEDAERLIASGTINSTPIESTDSKNPASSPSSEPKIPTRPSLPQIETIEAKPESIDLSKNAADVIPLIQKVDDRDTLELLMMEESEGENRKGVKNAINAQIESLK